MPLIPRLPQLVILVIDDPWDLAANLAAEHPVAVVEADRGEPAAETCRGHGLPALHLPHVVAAALWPSRGRKLAGDTAFREVRAGKLLDERLLEGDDL
jgi:hypothetical protein